MKNILALSRFQIPKITLSRVNLWLFFISFLVHFSLPIVVGPDSVKYLYLSAIFSGEVPFEHWDLVRLPGFPALLYLSESLFGKNPYAIILVTWFFWVGLLYSVDFSLKTCTDLDKSDKQKIRTLLWGFICLNPILISYYHLMLTEFVAISLSILSSAYSFQLFKEENRKNQIKLGVIILTLATVLFLTKQIFVLLVLAPLCAIILLALLLKEYKKMFSFAAFIIGIVVFVLLTAGVWKKMVPEASRTQTGHRETSSFATTLIKNVVVMYSFPQVYKIYEINEAKRKGLRNHMAETEFQLLTEILQSPSSLKAQCSAVHSVGTAKDHKDPEKIQYIVYECEKDSLSAFFSFLTKCMAIDAGLVRKAYFKTYRYLIGKYQGTIPPYISMTFRKFIDGSEPHRFKLVPFNERTQNLRGSNFLMADRHFAMFNAKEMELLENYRVHEKSSVAFIPHLLLWMNYIIVPLFTSSITFTIYTFWAGLVLLLFRYRGFFKGTTFQFVFVLSTTSFIFILANVLLSARIDRYAMPIFPLSLYVTILTIYLFFKKSVSYLKSR